MRRKYLGGLVGALSLAAVAAPASALNVNGSGQVTDWGNLLPLQQTGASDVVTNLAPGVTSFRQNDWAPTLGGLGPTPTGGERFDLEEMHVRRNGDTLEFLLVASGDSDTPFRATSGSNQWTLGDLFLDHDGVSGFDHALVMAVNDTGVSGAINTTLEDINEDRSGPNAPSGGLTAGDLYGVDTTLGLRGGPYDGTTTEPLLVPWALDGTSASQRGMNVGGNSDIVAWAEHDYGDPHDVDNNGGTNDRENPTWLYELVVDFSTIGGVPAAGETVDFHMIWGCGNDVFEGSYTIPGDGQSTPGVPEPATAALGMIGLVGGAARLRRRR